ncbi:MAG: DUF2103 domain-containing protein [Actinobacteria bacterium]|nr:DUF2103 domain-containing protein [Actinomycetota bacterium]
MAKHRHRGVKREHHVLPGTVALLEELAAHPAVAAVIPGRIRVTRGAVSGLEVRVQVPTATGHKLALRSGHAVQEVFLVAKNAEALAEYLAARFGA